MKMLVNLNSIFLVHKQLSPSYETLYECGATQDLSKNTKIVIKVT